MKAGDESSPGEAQMGSSAATQPSETSVSRPVISLDSLIRPILSKLVADAKLTGKERLDSTLSRLEQVQAELDSVRQKARRAALKTRETAKRAEEAAALRDRVAAAES